MVGLSDLSLCILPVVAPGSAAGSRGAAVPGRLLPALGSGPSCLCDQLVPHEGKDRGCPTPSAAFTALRAPVASLLVVSVPHGCSDSGRTMRRSAASSEALSVGTSVGSECVTARQSLSSAVSHGCAQARAVLAERWGSLEKPTEHFPPL